jgi:hypothetical protein
MRCGKQRKTPQPRGSQAERSQHERQATARGDTKGGHQAAQCQRHSAKSAGPLIPRGFQQIVHDNLLALRSGEPTVCSNYRRKRFLESR